MTRSSLEPNSTPIVGSGWLWDVKGKPISSEAAVGGEHRRSGGLRTVVRNLSSVNRKRMDVFPTEASPAITNLRTECCKSARVEVEPVVRRGRRALHYAVRAEAITRGPEAGVSRRRRSQERERH